MNAFLAFFPLIQLAVKLYMENRQATAEELASVVARLNGNEQTLDQIIKQIETDPVLADLVAQRHKRDVVPSNPQDVPPPIENV